MSPEQGKPETPARPRDGWLDREIGVAGTVFTGIGLALLPLSILAGFTWAIARRGDSSAAVAMVVPACAMLFVAGGCAYIVLETLARFRWRSRAASSVCTRCGYDLAGIGSGRCPECGTTNARSAPFLPLFLRAPPAVRWLIVAVASAEAVAVVMWIAYGIEGRASMFRWLVAAALSAPVVGALVAWHVRAQRRYRR